MSGQAFFYSVIRLQTSLVDVVSKDIPLAVVVQGETDSSVYIIGLVPSRPDDLSDIGWAIIQKFPEMLVRQISEEFKKNPKINIIAALAQHNRWNIYLSPMQSIQEDHPLKEVAWLLYGRLIEGAPADAARCVWELKI